MLRDGTVPVEIAWANMVLILKGEGGYRGIGMVEVLWKVYSVVVNCWLKRNVVLHDALRGFIEGRGMGMETATLKAKLDQQLAGLAHDPLFQVFLDVRKAYDSLDQERCLELLRGYRMGANLDRLLDNYWPRQMIVPKLGKYPRTAFGSGRGVTHGDPKYPMIFNIVVYGVVRAVLEEV